MYKAVNFWAALRKPGGHLTARPGAYSQGSMEEMQLVLQHSWDAWREPPGGDRADQQGTKVMSCYEVVISELSACLQSLLEQCLRSR